MGRKNQCNPNGFGRIGIMSKPVTRLTCDYGFEHLVTLAWRLWMTVQGAAAVLFEATPPRKD